MSGLDDLTREELIALVIKLDERVRLLTARVAELEEEVSRLGGPKSKPSWVKPSKAKKEAGPRKKRTQCFSRHNLPPTKVCYHGVESCPECGRKLSGGWVKWNHEVIETPDTPVEVTDHLFMERQCGVCGKRYVPDSQVVLREVVVGKRSIGIRLMSLIAHLKIVCRVPIGLIRRLLGSLYGINISKGEIAEILHAVAQIGELEYDGLRNRIRGSPVAHGDETGWRENGVNGYLWSFSTPDVHYFTYNQSRAVAVVSEVLGDEFAGVLVSDFYGGYNAYEGVKQRCWIHFKRDLEALSEEYSDDESVVSWVASVLEVYYRAKDVVCGNWRETERCRLRARFESELQALADPYVPSKNAPQRVLAQRIDRFVGEMFTFVEYPDVPSENNAAERAIRPAVIARKISGRTRSARGSKTTSILRSLFETWRAQKLNTIDA